ncbi:MAG: iron-containing alcohol dehydrogenase [Gammaproteobacteria bacterium]|nr:iron-containing alcohol dehydrogenase [Gammaproteobacteria bacterium]
MKIPDFSISGLPRMVFGEDSLAEVPALAASFGKQVLLVTGGASFETSAHWPRLTGALRGHGLSWRHLRVKGEPSPQLVDQAVRDYRHAGIEVVLGIGGGSVLDAAKAIAGLLPHGNSVLDHLEGVGPEIPYRGPSTPFIAVPTTAGTGSEATKNAVLSVQGKDGFKKSFRHDLLVPRYTVVDPALLAGCPPALIAANGMDALTQLLESYVSSKANPFTDALAWSGLTAVRDGLLPWYERDDAAGRGNMAYGALLSGITLAQAGLGSVHGLASPLGAFFPIPHGVVCGTLVATATRVNIQALQARDPGSPALEKYARAGELFSGRSHPSKEAARHALVETLSAWTERLRLPPLRDYGIETSDFDAIVANCRGSSMKTNPIVLDDIEIREILERRLYKKHPSPACGRGPG